MGKCVLDQNFNPNRRNTFNQNVHHAPVGFLKSIPWQLKSDIDATCQIIIEPTDEYDEHSEYDECDEYIKLCLEQYRRQNLY